MTTYRILVTGSRDWDDEGVIHAALSDLLFANPSMVLVHGDCPRGADRIADHWAELRNSAGGHVLVERHPADWDRYRRAAGFRRNAEMVATRPDLVLAFIRNGSPGATHCASLAEKAGIPVRRWTA